MITPIQACESCTRSTFENVGQLDLILSKSNNWLFSETFLKPSYTCDLSDTWPIVNMLRRTFGWIQFSGGFGLRYFIDFILALRQFDEPLHELRRTKKISGIMQHPIIFDTCFQRKELIERWYNYKIVRPCLSSNSKRELDALQFPDYMV